MAPYFIAITQRLIESANSMKVHSSNYVSITGTEARASDFRDRRHAIKRTSSKLLPSNAVRPK